MAVRGGGRCLGGGARPEEVEQGPGPGDRSPGGGTGAGGGASASRGCVPRPPGTETRSPTPSKPTSPRSVPTGRSRPTGVTRRRQSLILLPGRSLGASVPPGTGRHRLSGRDPRLHRSESEPQVGRRCGPAHAPPPSPSSPLCSRPPRHPPSSRVTGVDGRRGRAGPWRSR